MISLDTFLKMNSQLIYRDIKEISKVDVSPVLLI